MSKQVFQVRDFSGRKIVDVRAGCAEQAISYIANTLKAEELRDEQIANLVREGIGVIDAPDRITVRHGNTLPGSVGAAAR